MSQQTFRTHGPQLRPIKPQQSRTDECQPQGHKRQQAVSPSQTQCIIHLHRKERKAESTHCTHKSAHRCRRRSVLRLISVRGVCLTALEANNHANSDDDATDVWRDPMCACLCGPAVDEESDGTEDAGDEHRRDAKLGESFFEAVVCLEAGIEL